MSDWNNWKNPFEDDYYKRFNPRQPNKFMNDIMREMEDLLKEFLNEDGVNKKMKKMGRKTTLKATVKRGNKVYSVIINDITPDSTEIPDEISIEWDEDGGFGNGHDDLKE